jgi:hypothetical protein
MAQPLTELEEINNSIVLERPARPFHSWLSFRSRAWPETPPFEMGLPHMSSMGVGAAICYMTQGFFSYAMETCGGARGDYEVWYVDRVDKIFMRLKSFGSEEMDPDCKYSVPGWAKVPPDWNVKRKIFDQPDGSPDPCGIVLVGRAAELFEAKWAKWTGGPITVTPNEFTLDDEEDGTADAFGADCLGDPEDGGGEYGCDDPGILEFVGTEDGDPADGATPDAGTDPPEGGPGGGSGIRGRNREGGASAPGEIV